MSKITPSPLTGLTLTEYVEQRVDKGKPFVYCDPYGGIPQREHYTSNIRAHQFEPFGFRNKGFRCKVCNLRSMTPNNIRSGCHVFSSLQSNPHWACNEQEELEVRYANIEEEYVITGCYIHDRSEWVQYPNTGKTIQEDKFINEQVKKAMKDNARI